MERKHGCKYLETLNIYWLHSEFQEIHKLNLGQETEENSIKKNWQIFPNTHERIIEDDAKQKNQYVLWIGILC